jgi:hypothetical protein
VTHYGEAEAFQARDEEIARFADQRRRRLDSQPLPEPPRSEADGEGGRGSNSQGRGYQTEGSPLSQPHVIGPVTPGRGLVDAPRNADVRLAEGV